MPKIRSRTAFPTLNDCKYWFLIRYLGHNSLDLWQIKIDMNPLRFLMIFGLILVTNTVSAWGPTGHRVVTEIAENHLTKKTKKKSKKSSVNSPWLIGPIGVTLSDQMLLMTTQIHGIM